MDAAGVAHFGDRWYIDSDATGVRALAGGVFDEDGPLSVAFVADEPRGEAAALVLLAFALQAPAARQSALIRSEMRAAARAAGAAGGGGPPPLPAAPTPAAKKSPARPAPNRAAAPDDERGALLADIAKGVQLKSVSNRQPPKEPRAPQTDPRVPFVQLNQETGVKKADSFMEQLKQRQTKSSGKLGEARQVVQRVVGGEPVSFDERVRAFASLLGQLAESAQGLRNAARELERATENRKAQESEIEASARAAMQAVESIQVRGRRSALAGAF